MRGRSASQPTLSANRYAFDIGARGARRRVGFDVAELIRGRNGVNEPMFECSVQDAWMRSSRLELLSSKSLGQVPGGQLF